MKLGVGYETEEGIRGIAGWRDYNFLGGARQLGVSAAHLAALSHHRRRTSSSPTSRARPAACGSSSSRSRQSTTTYDLLETKLLPRLEWDVTPRLTTYAFYRASLDLLSQRDIPPSVRQRAPRRRRPVAVGGVGARLRHRLNGTDDLVNPTRGGIARFSVEPVGGVLGGDVDLVRA